jgi:hypothetical protein
LLQLQLEKHREEGSFYYLCGDEEAFAHSNPFVRAGDADGLRQAAAL